MIADPKFNTAKEWFEKLRDNLVETIQNIDENQFEISNWDHKGDGGGKMSKIKGNIIEKGGVNISTVSGTFNENMRDAIPGAKKIQIIMQLASVLYYILFLQKFLLCILIQDLLKPLRNGLVEAWILHLV